ncbi:MAG: hypothetical protein JRN35_09255 [Nitrososphaerota archaeon]|nr:hypothetical protein [Nitrososphaerota archaeon]
MVDRVQDADLYGRLLGLEPAWTVVRVTLNVKEEWVGVYLEHGEGAPWSCPQRGKRLSGLMCD